MPVGELFFDVTEAIPTEFSAGQRLRIAAWLFLPQDLSTLPARPPVIACLNGGSYDRRYFHVDIPGHPGYSMAQHLADQGAIVLVLDHLGIGASSRPSVPHKVTRQIVAIANDSALRQAYALLAAGTLHEGLQPIADFLKVGVGHSMGSMQTITQQAEHETYDRIIVLGYSAIGVHLTVNGKAFSADPGPLDPNAAPYWRLDRSLVRESFHWDDVPEAVLAADDAINVEVPNVISKQSVTTGIVQKDAAKISVPIFICLGERDVSPDAHAEPACYASSKDITLFILPRSGHCQSFASTRNILYDRMMEWINLRSSS